MSPIQTFFLQGPAGRLEALLNAGEPDATHAALVCHPHPLFGGTMHNKVVYNAAKALRGFGFPVLRFNFRGTGRSQGEHANGEGERDDVAAALDWLRRELALPIVFAGFSFGAAVGMRVACQETAVAALIGLGLPIQAENRSYTYEFLAHCAKPKLFISGGADQYGARTQLERIVAAAAEPKQLVIIDDADHFFAGQLPAMQSALRDWLSQTLGVSPRT